MHCQQEILAMLRSLQYIVTYLQLMWIYFTVLYEDGKIFDIWCNLIFLTVSQVLFLISHIMKQSNCFQVTVACFNHLGYSSNQDVYQLTFLRFFGCKHLLFWKKLHRRLGNKRKKPREHCCPRPMASANSFQDILSILRVTTVWQYPSKLWNKCLLLRTERNMVS